MLVDEALSLPPALPASLEVPLAVHALEFARVMSVPTEPLAAYVLDTDREITDEAVAGIVDRLGRTGPRVVTEHRGRLVVGWAPLRLMADVMARVDRTASRELRSAPPSDVAVWTIVHIGEAATVVRARRADLQARFVVRTTLSTVLDYYGGEFPKTRGAWIVTEPAPGPCDDGGAHDADGQHNVLFRQDGSLLFHGRECSKCFCNNFDDEDQLQRRRKMRNQPPWSRRSQRPSSCDKPPFPVAVYAPDAPRSG